MSEEEITLPGLERFNLGPNPEAHLLEEALGIRFDRVPYKAPFDITTKFELVREKSPWSEKLAQIAYLLTSIAARYDEERNIVFSDGDQYHDLHENAHAWIQQINPELYSARKSIVAALKARKIIVPDDGLSRANVERLVCFICLDEGLAEWMAKEAHFRIKEARIRGDDTFPKDIVFLTGHGIDQELEAIKQGIGKSFNKLGKVVDKMSGALNKTGLGMLVNFLSGARVLQTTRYEVGEYFCLGAINTLIGNDVPLNRALELLVKNPPEQLAQLQNPKAYIANLLAHWENNR